MSEETPATWVEVAPLLARWQMALVPYSDGTWDVLSGYCLRPRRPRHEVRRVRFADLPQAVADVAARCDKECTMENGKWRMKS